MFVANPDSGAFAGRYSGDPSHAAHGRSQRYNSDRTVAAIYPGATSDQVESQASERPLVMHFEVLVGGVTKELRAAGSEVGESSNVPLGCRGSCLVKVDRGHACSLVGRCHTAHCLRF